MAVVNPAQVRAFGHAGGQRAKTDASMRGCWRVRGADAAAGAPAPDAATQELRGILARRRQVGRCTPPSGIVGPTPRPGLRPGLEAHRA